MMRRGLAECVRSALAAGLVLWFAIGPGLVAPAMAQAGTGIIRGFLYGEDEINKISGGRVVAINIKTGMQFESNLTGENGAYQIVDIPAGTYDIVMDAGGVFIINTLIELAEGQRLMLSLARQPGMSPDRNVPGMDEPSGTAVPTTALPSATAPPPGSRSYWKTTAGIVLLSVLGAGAAVALVNAFQDDDKKASVSEP
jgi:hypothetical protein